MVLTVMQFDPEMRVAMNIRYSEKALAACKEIGLCAASFSREEEPAGVSTMEWGVSEAVRRAGRVPDVIYDPGAVGKEAMIRMLGRDAVEVAGRAVEVGVMMNTNSRKTLPI